MRILPITCLLNDSTLKQICGIIFTLHKNAARLENRTAMKYVFIQEAFCKYQRTQAE